VANPPGRLAGSSARRSSSWASTKPRGEVPRYFDALVHAGLGDGPAALDALEQAWQERDSMLRELKVDPP
jgi:hypothetical protein